MNVLKEQISLLDNNLNFRDRDREWKWLLNTPHSFKWHKIASKGSWTLLVYKQLKSGLFFFFLFLAILGPII